MPKQSARRKHVFKLFDARAECSPLGRERVFKAVDPRPESVSFSRQRALQRFQLIGMSSPFRLE